MSETQKTIDDAVVEGVAHGKAALAEIFKTEDMLALADYSKVLAAMRMMSDDMIDQLAKPIILRMFQIMSYDPTTPEGRADMLPFQDNIALALQDAMTIIIQQQQAREMNTRTLAAGRGAVPGKLIT